MEKPTWIPLESNPETFNKYLENLGINDVECIEIYGFDDEFLEAIPWPQHGLILCYQCSDHADVYLKKSYENYKAAGKNKIPEDVFFMKQKIKNACGTFALLHVLTNNVDKIDIGSGPFAKWYKQAKLHDVYERSDLLANNAEMAASHKDCAQHGETAAPEADKVEYHFIAYVNVDGRLMEFDSAQDFPIDCGPTDNQHVMVHAAKKCKQFMEILGDIKCNALAIVKKIE